MAQTAPKRGRPPGGCKQRPRRDVWILCVAGRRRASRPPLPRGQVPFIASMKDAATSDELPILATEASPCFFWYFLPPSLGSWQGLWPFLSFPVSGSMLLIHSSTRRRFSASVFPSPIASPLCVMCE
eukprot:TRINITY_DN9787_c0_g1_i2.p2 TRINITY_DN9787_c0_g1~~TRINITY_DN9787_c0_g1_i2.p2  ORF type:complete len:127 (-),score=9.35 TRINITY_DN9787_c0_g1_i2:39-419(-)